MDEEKHTSSEIKTGEEFILAPGETKEILVYPSNEQVVITPKHTMAVMKENVIFSLDSINKATLTNTTTGPVYIPVDKTIAYCYNTDDNTASDYIYNMYEADEGNGFFEEPDNHPITGFEMESEEVTIHGIVDDNAMEVYNIQNKTEDTPRNKQIKKVMEGNQEKPTDIANHQSGSFIPDDPVAPYIPLKKLLYPKNYRYVGGGMKETEKTLGPKYQQKHFGKEQNQPTTSKRVDKVIENEVSKGRENFKSVYLPEETISKELAKNEQGLARKNIE